MGSQADNKNNWKHESGFIWSMIGSAVGFANILAFGSKAYSYGGGAFLVPFTVSMVVLGLPLLFLEGIIGQKFALPLVSAYGCVARNKGKFFGWLAILAVATIGSYYIVLTGFTVAYTYFSAVDKIPLDAGTFFKHVFLEDSGSLMVFGGFAQYAFIFTLLVALFSWWVMVKNVQSGVERICSIFLPLLSIIIAACAIVVCFLPGAFEGFKRFLIPDFSRLLDPRLWLMCFGHVFFSLSLGLGIVTGYSRHADSSINIPRSMFWVLVGDFLISLISGFAIFGCIGYMSNLTGMPFDSIVRAHSSFEMGFVVFPTILRTFGSLYQILAPLFFFCVFIAGVTGVFSIIESIAGNIEVEFGKSRQFAVTVASIVMSIGAILFCMGNGQHIIGALEPMVNGFNMLISGMAEILIFMFGSTMIANHLIWFTGEKRTIFYYLLCYVNLAILFLILIAAIINEYETGFGYPEMVRWGWLVGAVIVAVILSRSGVKKK